VGDDGLEPSSGSALPANDLRQSANRVGTFSGTVADETGTLPPDLGIVVSAWKSLSEGDRKALLTIIREASAKAEEEIQR
jgi:hypothetical protein